MPPQTDDDHEFEPRSALTPRGVRSALKPDPSTRREELRAAILRCMEAPDGSEWKNLRYRAADDLAFLLLDTFVLDG